MGCHTRLREKFRGVYHYLWHPGGGPRFDHSLNAFKDMWKGIFLAFYPDNPFIDICFSHIMWWKEKLSLKTARELSAWEMITCTDSDFSLLFLRGKTKKEEKSFSQIDSKAFVGRITRKLESFGLEKKFSFSCETLLVGLIRGRQKIGFRHSRSTSPFFP